MSTRPADRAVQMLRDGFSPRQAAVETGLTEDQVAEAIRNARLPDRDSVDNLLAYAAVSNDERTLAAHAKAITAIEALRELIKSATARRQAAEQLAAAEAALQAAREAAKALGVPLPKRTYKKREPTAAQLDQMRANGVKARAALAAKRAAS